MAKKKLSFDALSKNKAAKEKAAQEEIKKEKTPQEKIEKEKNSTYHAGRKSHVPKTKRDKITITISKDLLKEMDIALIANDTLIESLDNHVNRSSLIHNAIADYLEKHKE